MEPLTEENEKLKEAMKLMEKNVQRAQCERDLAESNARDLEYQKSILSEQLATTFELLWGKSEQLATISERLTSVSEQLEWKSEQLRNVSEQRKGMAYRRFCFALLNSHSVADDGYACKARCGARPATPNRQATLGGAEEDSWVGGEVDRGAER